MCSLVDRLLRSGNVAPSVFSSLCYLLERDPQRPQLGIKDLYSSPAEVFSVDFLALAVSAYGCGSKGWGKCAEQLVVVK